MTKEELDALNLQKLGEELSDRINAAFFGKPSKRAAKKKPKIPGVIVPPSPSNAPAEAPVKPELTSDAGQWLFGSDFGVSREPRKRKEETNV